MTLADAWSALKTAPQHATDAALGVPDIPAFAGSSTMAKLMGVKVGGFPLMFRMAAVGEAPTEVDATLEEVVAAKAEETAKRAALPNAALEVIPWLEPSYGTSRAPEVGAPAPDGPLRSLAGYSSTLHKAIDAAGKESGSPRVAVVFFSSTCPVWNWAGAWTYPKQLADAGVPVVFVYVTEYHTADGLPVPGMVPSIPMPTTTSAKVKACEVFGRPLVQKAMGRPVDCWVDDAPGHLDAAYEARPWRVYVVDAESKTVAFRAGPGPVNGIAKAKLLADFLGARPEPPSYAKAVVAVSAAIAAVALAVHRRK
mmetsp:Transcript_20001/g.59591  ORF Transcript_20001/g.59591 Transcript_20001/m.59591 type:complete len:311 (-) Transcript_20001:64-996(-)|eukprot:CAMPEP_0119277368 /NCGR_PEP_ID=MMETSP1329-20130426/16970_1 /TAXON_ID=114041 /ORGANISM="Genus nov. species nov., Strain RCC1024" /LENGTH=310 /DNA_ID=CAMNT_0007277833 /DNA_START=136 /DNA_END=1068 /DNA_ORIENTATION=+